MSRRYAGWLVSGFASLALVVAGCGGGDGGDGGEEAGAGAADTVSVEETAEPAPAPVASEYAPELGVDLSAMNESPSGLYWQVLSEGSGPVAEAGRTVRVHYTGWLPSGETFDSSRERGEPFQFLLGAGRVIPGWDQGVAGMAVGERRLLVIPPTLGYGPRGVSGLIPPNSTLVFDVELLGIE